jgi:Secretion system C-terminal sorting domain
MKNLIGILFACIIFNSSAFAANYTWTGSTNTTWGTSSNWSPSGVPGSSDTININSTTNSLTLTTNQTVKRLTMNSGILDLGGDTLIITGSSGLHGGNINNGHFKTQTSGLIYFHGTSFGAEVSAVGQIKLDGSVFDSTAYFEHNSSASGTGAGGNTFNGVTTLKNAGTTTFRTAGTNSDTFNNNVFLISASSAGSSNFQMSYGAATYFNGNIEVSSSSTFGISFSSAGNGSSTLANGKTITIGSGGFTGTLLIKNFTQTGSTSQSLSLSGVLNISNSTFNGSFSSSSSSILLSNCNFNNQASFIKTGTANDFSAGGNYFASTTTFNNSSSTTAKIRLAATSGDSFVGATTFITTNGLIEVAYVDTTEFTGDVTINNSKVTFNNSSGFVLCTGSASQEFGGSADYKIGKLIINKTTNGLTLQRAVTIDSSLTLTKGIIYTDTIYLVTLKAGSTCSGASNISYVEGPIKKIGNTSFIFPIGKSGYYRSLSASAPGSSTDAFTAEYFDSQQSVGDSMVSTIDFLSQCNYWTLKRIVGSSSVNVSFSWDTTFCSILDSADLRVANWDGSKWKDLSVGTFNGTKVAGSSQNDSSVVSYGYFTHAYRTTDLPISSLITDTIIQADSILRLPIISSNGTASWYPSFKVSTVNSTTVDITTSNIGYIYLTTEDYKGRKAIDSILVVLDHSNDAINFSNSLAPGVEWRSSEWLDEYPNEPNIFGSLAGTDIDHEDSGEDWWYAHTNSYDSNGDLDGYFCGGYVTYVNFGYDETNSDGCQVFDVDPSCYVCNELEGPGFVKGESYAVVSLQFPHGQDYVWDRVLVAGAIQNVKQTSDGGYIAVGISSSTRTFDNMDLIYNPMENQINTNAFNCNGNPSWQHPGCASGTYSPRQFAYAVKLDRLGEVEWQYIYGTVDHSYILVSSNNSIKSDAWDVVETSFGFVMVGYSMAVNDGGAINFLNTPANKFSNAAWYLNPQGEIITVGSQGQFGFFDDYSENWGNLAAVASYVEGTDEKIVFTGFQQYAQDLGQNTCLYPHLRTHIFQVDGSDLFPDDNSEYEWVIDDGSINASACSQNNTVWDVAVQANVNTGQVNEILLPILYDCTSGYGVRNSCASAMVYRIDGITGNLIRSADFGHIETYDLKIGITPLLDGGYAIVSGRNVTPPILPSPTCQDPGPTTVNMETWTWGADAYIARADINDNVIWSTTVDIDYEAAVQYPGLPGDDVKKQECLYSITQSDDGGFVVAGNNGVGFDDFYMIKLFAECDAIDQSYSNISTAQSSNFVQDINSNQTWSSDQTLIGSIHIKSGVTLTIDNNATIRFADSKRVARSNGHNIISNLVVEPNGKLIINGGATLDVVNSCSSSMWDGVLVWGNPFLSQAFSNQGYVLANNCSIKNARTGMAACGINYDLYVNGSIDYSKGGGIIRASSGTVFENCRKGAFFSPYPLPLGTSSNFNKSFFSGVSFICNDVMRDPLYQDSNGDPVGVNEHLSIYGTNGILINNTSFDNTASTLTQLEEHGVGISSAEAYIKVGGGCSFENMHIGISSKFGAFMKGINVVSSAFANNRQGILLEGGFGSYISGNDFSIPADQLGAKLPFGVMTVNAEGFSIDHNKFIGVVEEGNFGVVVRQSGANGTGADVRLNPDFASTHVGTQTEANNDNLRISCNEYTGHRYAWYIAPGSAGTLGDQGTGCDPSDIRAGNIFYDDHTEAEEHISSTITFDYWAWGNPGQTDPTYYTNSDVSSNLLSPVNHIFNCGESTDDPSCAEETPCTDPNCIEAYIERLAEIENKQEWNRAFNEINRYFLQNDSNGTDDSYVAFLESVSDSSMGIAKLLSNLFLTRGDFAKADSMLDVVELLTDDTCITTFDRMLISLMEDSLSLFDLTFEEWQNYQSCIESSESTSLRYEIIEDILDFVKHPREPEVPASLRLLPPSSQESRTNSTEFSVSNNPGNGDFILNWNVSEHSEDFYMVRVYDVLGKNVLYKKVRITDGNLPLHLDEFKSGVYLIRIMNEKSNTFEEALKIVKR